MDARATLKALFEAAVASADPARCVARHLPARPAGRTEVIGYGKAAAAMARAVEAAWDGPIGGLALTRYGHGVRCERIEVVEAGHPLPDDAGAAAAGRALALAGGLGPDDLLLALASGGGSALLSLPAAGVTMADKRAVTAALLASGAPIADINQVRRHLSAAKNGGLARAAGAARVHTIVISDVPGDDPAMVASGPTLSDGSMRADALAVLARWGIAAPDAVLRHLRAAGAEQGDGTGPRSVAVAATAQDALDAAAVAARGMGLAAHVLSDRIEGEAAACGAWHAALARQVAARGQPFAPPCVLLSGGETSVTVRGDGSGGRNAEWLLGFAHAADGLANAWALAADTDGIDGAGEAAGGWVAPDTLARGAAFDLDAGAALARNDAGGFLAALGDALVTGPTRTNVNDFRAVLIGGAA